VNAVSCLLVKVFSVVAARYLRLGFCRSMARNLTVQEATSMCLCGRGSLDVAAVTAVLVCVCVSESYPCQLVPCQLMTSGYG